MMFDIQSTLNH